MSSTVTITNSAQQMPCYALPTPSPPPEPETLYQRHQKSVAQQQQQQDASVAPKRSTTTPSTTFLLKKETMTATRPFVSRWLNVIQKLLKELDGRDKLMKIIQYFVKILLHYKLVQAKHWSVLTSHFSMTRKLLRLGTAIGPMRELSPLKSSIPQTLIILNALVNNVSDDVFCLHKLGMVGPYLGAKSERISAYCWFAGIMVDIRECVDNMIKLQQKAAKSSIDEKQESKTMTELRQKIFVAEISTIKLLMDAIFCGEFLFIKYIYPKDNFINIFIKYSL
jgi:hypothetical protein